LSRISAWWQHLSCKRVVLEILKKVWRGFNAYCFDFNSKTDFVCQNKVL
jgi:hypothetical protein